MFTGVSLGLKLNCAFGLTISNIAMVWPIGRDDKHDDYDLPIKNRDFP